MKQLLIAIVLVAATPAHASDDHNLMEICKAHCPNAKTEHEAHECMRGVAKKMKNDKKFRKSDCNEALVAHEKHEKEEGHSH